MKISEDTVCLLVPLRKIYIIEKYCNESYTNIYLAVMCKTRL